MLPDDLYFIFHKNDQKNEPTQNLNAEIEPKLSKTTIKIGELKDEVGGRDEVYNAVLVIVSHPDTFRLRTRTVVRAVYEERFVLFP
ncbi:hypothetical protein BDV29DRAFT_156496 [Aspergillus leporis]|uniref:Uncharacterized protein n=1 Tax=Aspergillus leporis TaxID=41062 RepID=A0A5N5X3M1_9EURO|nr:hypothetical protein BDV29DRAFT_156496 [Aspergillus leporis]